jgi:hypothetical protein
MPARPAASLGLVEQACLAAAIAPAIGPGRANADRGDRGAPGQIRERSGGGSLERVSAGRQRRDLSYSEVIERPTRRRVAKSGHVLSLSEISVTGSGQAIANAGSSWRTPSAASRA